MIKTIDINAQYNPIIDSILKKEFNFKFEKSLEKQIKPLTKTPFEWVDTYEKLKESAHEI
jgi:Txe/YoeB family toxin of Txe-Axe toxin-antitoxin module